MTLCTPETTGAVTVTFIRGVRAGREREYEAALKELQVRLHAVPGYLGTDVVHDATLRRYTSIVRFDSLAHQRTWEASGQREAWQRELTDIVTGDAEVRHAEGLEFWFLAPEHPAKAPSRHKMAIILLVVVTIVSLPLSAVITTYLGDQPRILRVLVSASVQVGLLNYVLMPRITRLLSGWLYAEPSPLPRPRVS
jgi:hypothetical protein